MASSPRTPGSPRASPRTGDKNPPSFFNQATDNTYEVFDLVEILCDDEETGAASWLPARVTQVMDSSLEVLMLGERDSFEVHESSVRAIAELDGEAVPPVDVVPGLICSVWYAQGGDYYDAQVDGSDEPGTAVVTYLAADEQEEVPLRYLRQQPSIEEHHRKHETHAQFMARQLLKIENDAAKPTRFQEFNLSDSKKGHTTSSSASTKRRLPLEPHAAMQLLRAESTRVFRRLKMGPKEFYNKANRYHAMAVLPHEIADTLATLTNFDVASDDPVMDLVMAELDPTGVGECTLAMLKKNWPQDWKEAMHLYFHAAAVKPDDKEQWTLGKKEKAFGGWLYKSKGTTGSPRGMSYAQQAAAGGKNAEKALSTNTFSYGDALAERNPGYTEGMTKEDLLEERKAAAASKGSSRVQAPRSRAGWGNSHIRRKALDEWQATLLVDNEIGWGVYGYKGYTPKAPRMSGVLPEDKQTKNQSKALPLDPEQACAMVQSKLVSSVQRLNMKPRHFFNAMHLSSKEKTLSREAMRNGLHRFTKYTITDPVLDHILEILNPEKEDGDTISFKTMHENFNKLVPDPKAAAKAKADAEKSAKAELKKQEKVAAEKVGAKAARAEARKSRNAERAVRREQKVEKQNAKAQAKLAAKEAKEKRKLAKQSSQVKRPSEPQRIDYDYEMTVFSDGDLVEVKVSADEDADDDTPEQWLPARVLGDFNADENSYKVVMLVGYDDDDATFDVEAECVRAIVKKDGTDVNPSKIDEGTKVLAWNPLEGDFYDCTVASVLTEGTVTVSWDNHDDDDESSEDEDDDELPMVYLRSSNGAEDEGGPSSQGGPQYSVCAIFNMKDLTPDAFTEPLQDRFRDDLAEALDMNESQITIQDFAAGSLIVDVRFSGLEDKSASAALATRLALECATLLDAHVFGKVKVLRGEIKELVEEADGGDEEADWTDDEDEDFHIDTESEDVSEDSVDSVASDIKLGGTSLPGTDPLRPPNQQELIEINVADKTNDEDDYWLPAEVLSDPLPDGSFKIRALIGYDAEDACFEVDTSYMRAIPTRTGNAIDPTKVQPGLVLRAWASSRLDFFRAKVVQVNHKLGSASIVWAGDNDDDDDEDVWENEEEELPLAYLRSISGHEDLTNAEPSSPHSPHSGGSKLEQRLSKAVEIRRTIGDAQAMSTTSGDYHHHSPTGRHASSPLADTPFPNELSGLLDEFALSSCYEKVAAYAKGTSLERNLRPLGESGLIEAGIPVMKARKVWRRINELSPLNTASSRDSPRRKELEAAERKELLKKQTNSDAMRSSPRRNQSAIQDGHNFQPKLVSSASKRNRQATTTWLSSSSETTTGGMQELTAKEQRKADEANAAFERELRGDFDHRNNENEDQSNQHAGGGSRIRDEVAHALEESTGWANPSAVEAEMVWSRLEAHFERHHMDVTDFLRHIERVEDGVHLDSNDFARALNRFLKLDLGHATLQAIITVAEKSTNGEVVFTPLDPPSPTLEAGPFQPRGYFRRASTFMGKFSGYCFKLDDRGLGYYRDPSQGPAWYEQLQPSQQQDDGRNNPFDAWSPLQPLFDVTGVGAVPKPYYQQTPGHKSPSSLKAANTNNNSPRASPTHRQSPTTRFVSGSENFNSMNATQFDEFAITQQPNQQSNGRMSGSFSKGTHEYPPLPDNEEEAYDELLDSARSAFGRMALGVVQFYNLVNNKKRFFVTPNEIAAGLRHLTSLDLHVGHPAMQRLLRLLDPDQTFEMTLPMLKKHWLPEFKAAIAVKDAQKELNQGIKASSRFMAHPSVNPNLKGTSVSNGAAGARSTGGWANRTTRRKAQGIWQPSLLEEGNEFGWGANGYKPYHTKPIKVETPKNAIVGTAKAKRVILPEDPDSAKQVLKEKMKVALKKINALTFYNLANKKKAKFITSNEIKETLESITKINFTDEMTSDVMKILDPDSTEKVGVKMLKDNLPKLYAEDVSSSSHKTKASSLLEASIEALPGTKPPRPPRKGEIVEINVADQEAGEDDNWLPAVVMTEKKKTGGYGIRALSGYDEEDSHFDVDVDYMRVLRKKHVKGNPVDPLKLKPGLVCKCWATNADDFYSTKITKVNVKQGTATIMWDVDGDGDWNEDEEEVPIAYIRSLKGKEDMDPIKAKEMAAAEKEVNTKAAQQALVHAHEEEAAAAKHMAADERAQERELAKNGPTYSVAFICNIKDLTPASFDDHIQRKYKCNIADNLSLPRDILEIRGFAAGSLIVDTLIKIQMPSEERAMVLAKKLKGKEETLLDKTTFGKISINRGEIKVVKDESPTDEDSSSQTPSSVHVTPIKASTRENSKPASNGESLKEVSTSSARGKTTDLHVNTTPTELSTFLDEFGLSNLYASIQKVAGGDTLEELRRCEDGSPALFISRGVPPPLAAKVWSQLEERCAAASEVKSPAFVAPTPVPAFVEPLPVPEEALPNELSSILDEWGLSKHYETLKGAANGVSLPHLKQLGAAACVGLGVPKIRAAKLFKQVEEKCVDLPPPPPTQLPSNAFFGATSPILGSPHPQHQGPSQSTMNPLTPHSYAAYNCDPNSSAFFPGSPVSAVTAASLDFEPHHRHSVKGHPSVSEAGWAAVAAAGGVPQGRFNTSYYDDDDHKDDRASLYGWQRMQEANAKAAGRTLSGNYNDDQDDEDLPPPVSEWALPAVATVVLADGSEVQGLLKGSSTELVAVADNFVFRNFDIILEALDSIAASLATRSSELPLTTISHALRRLGAPLSVVTGPIYLWSHMDPSEHRAAFDYGNNSPTSGEDPTYASEVPERSATDYRRLVRNIATKHLLDMLVSGGTRLTTALGKVLGTLPSSHGSGSSGHFTGASRAEAVPMVAATVAEVLMAVARDHATTTMAGGAEKRRDKAGGYGNALNGNRGRHPLWWSTSHAFREASQGWVSLVLAPLLDGGSNGGRDAVTHHSSRAKPETLQAELLVAVERHRKREALSRRINTKFRTPEAAQDMFLRPVADPYGPSLPEPMTKKEATAAPHPSSPSSPKSPSDYKRSWMHPSSPAQSRAVIPEEDDAGDEVKGDDAGYLQVDRMCYFVIGNMHRLRAELRDRGLLHRNDGGASVTVATVVRALQVAASCSYPASDLAQMLARAVDPDGATHTAKRMYDNGIWDLPVDLRHLEQQLDDFLMSV